MRDQSGIGVLRAVVLAFAICAPAGHPSMAGVCYDISKGEPTTLDGILRYEISAGPPNYEDVQMGDMPEPTHILALSQKICLTGDDSADPSLQFDEVQIVASNRDVGMRMRSLVGLPVATALYDPIAAITGHHHRPLVVWVSEIEAASDSSDETVAEYGTAATVVRAFYYALGEGNGEVAASFVLPANTHAGWPAAGSVDG